MIKWRTVGTVILFMITYSGLLNSIQAQQSSEMRVLDRRITELELRVAELERIILESQTEFDSPIRFSDKWKDKSNWRKLRLGMTKSQIREILGEPLKINANAVLGDTWYYPDVLGGDIRFSTNGKVKSWSEP